MRNIFSRDDQRLELMSIIFEARNDDNTQQIHADFEDSIAVLKNEVFIFLVNNITNLNHFTVYNISKRKTHPMFFRLLEKKQHTYKII